jgi:hypothetical protein
MPKLIAIGMAVGKGSGGSSSLAGRPAIRLGRKERISSSARTRRKSGRRIAATSRSRPVAGVPPGAKL